MKHALLIAAIAATASPVYADTAELQLVATPQLSLVARHGRTNVGGGLNLRVSYGLLDNIDADLTLGCDHLSDLKQTGLTADNDIDAELFYDATRCLAVPGVSMRFGWRLVTTLSAGIGYRLERQSAREVASTTGVLIERQDAENVHQLVARVRGGVEYRITDWFTAGVVVAATPALAGGDAELDLSVAAVVGVYFYP